MGDKIGRVHVDRQDLSTLQSRKFKGLKKRKNEDGQSDGEVVVGEDGITVEKPLSGGGGEGRKRKKEE